MLFHTRMFGQLEIDRQSQITLPGGILGFEEQTRYALVAEAEDSPLYWLQSLELPELAFVVVDPFVVKEDYRPHLSQEDQNALQLGENSEEALFLAIVTLKEDYLQSTANLMAPIVINKRTRVGKQIILDDPALPIRCRLFHP